MMLRMLPMALFGAPFGALAERIDRRRALIVVVLGLLATSASMAALAFDGLLAVWQLALASFFSGIGWATDNPVRRVMIGETVGPERMNAAMSLDIAGNNGSRMLGPALGGLLLATFGVAGAFTLSLCLYLVALGAALRVSARPRPAASHPSPVLASLVEGLQLVRRDRRMVGILVITIIYNLFAWPFTSMIPVIGAGSLHLGAGGVGILASMDGIGSFVGAMLLAFHARPRGYVRLYIGGLAAYLVALGVFALIARPEPAGAVLLLTGLSSSCISIMQATLVYLSAPVDMRSRMYGVLSLCIGVGPIGFLNIGLLADAIGAPGAVVATALEGLAVLALTRRWWRHIGNPA
jgi:MFS family permease